VQLNWNKTGTNKEIISELKDRLLFDTDDYSQADFENIENMILILKQQVPKML
jgi:hypothetical protein